MTVEMALCATRLKSASCLWNATDHATQQVHRPDLIPTLLQVAERCCVYVFSCAAEVCPVLLICTFHILNLAPLLGLCISQQATKSFLYDGPMEQTLLLLVSC